MLPRSHTVQHVAGLLSRHPVVAIVGARQVGKTTLASMLSADWQGPVAHFDLEDPRHLSKLSDPMLALEPLGGLVVLDEIQHLPEIFEILRVLADRPDSPARFLVLGSASADLLRQTSESLAGRIAYVELEGLAGDEIGDFALQRLWMRGGYPRSFLAESDGASFEWRRELIRTFLERDLPQLGIPLDAVSGHRFWTMLAHVHGQIWNGSAFARSFGVSDHTVRRHLDSLASTFVVRQLPPWHENVKKRQVRSPKTYLSDSGLLHALLNLREPEDVESHPVVGASWEGFAIDAIRRRLLAGRDECFFWATHAGAEIDLVVVRGRRRLGFEVKRTVSPRVTRSMRIAIDDLHLDSLDVVHAGSDTYPLSSGVRALALERIWSDLDPLS